MFIVAGTPLTACLHSFLNLSSRSFHHPFLPSFFQSHVHLLFTGSVVLHATMPSAVCMWVMIGARCTTCLLSWCSFSYMVDDVIGHLKPGDAPACIPAGQQCSPRPDASAFLSADSIILIGCLSCTACRPMAVLAMLLCSCLCGCGQPALCGQCRILCNPSTRLLACPCQLHVFRKVLVCRQAASILEQQQCYRPGHAIYHHTGWQF